MSGIQQWKRWVEPLPLLEGLPHHKTSPILTSMVSQSVASMAHPRNVAPPSLINHRKVDQQINTWRLCRKTSRCFSAWSSYEESKNVSTPSLKRKSLPTNSLWAISNTINCWAKSSKLTNRRKIPRLSHSYTSVDMSFTRKTLKSSKPINHGTKMTIPWQASKTSMTGNLSWRKTMWTHHRKRS